MQILHPILQKSKDRRDIGNLKEFSLTELAMTEKKQLRKNCTFCFTKITSVPRSSKYQPTTIFVVCSLMTKSTQQNTTHQAGSPSKNRCPEKCADKSCVKEEGRHSPLIETYTAWSRAINCFLWLFFWLKGTRGQRRGGSRILRFVYLESCYFVKWKSYLQAKESKFFFL